MNVCERDLEKANWEYLQVNGEHYRMTEINERVVYPENSRRRLTAKAIEGRYTVMDMKVKGTGNTFLIMGWETVPSLAMELEGILS
jgi:hypothetical protein